MAFNYRAANPQNRNVTLNTENKSPSQLANEILMKVINLAEIL
jgi:hypothetical protein